VGFVRKKKNCRHHMMGTMNAVTKGLFSGEQTTFETMMFLCRKMPSKERCTLSAEHRSSQKDGYLWKKLLSQKCECFLQNKLPSQKINFVAFKRKEFTVWINLLN
jgi:hypothetical protein